MPLLDRRRQWQSRGALDVAGAPGGADSAELTQFLARISAPAAPRKAAYAALIDGLVADGVWPLIDALHIEGAVSTATANQNLKSSSFTLTNHGATFSTDVGYTGDGSSTWLDTNFDPNVVGSSNFKNDGSEGSLSVYITNSPSSGFNYALHSGGNVSFICPWFAGNIYCAIGGNGPNVSAGGTGGGQILASRIGAGVNAVQIYKNGAAVGALGGAAAAGGSTGVIALLASVGGTGNFLDARISATMIGGALTGPQSLAYMSRVNAFMTHLGINFY